MPLSHSLFFILMDHSLQEAELPVPEAGTHGRNSRVLGCRSLLQNHPWKAQCAACRRGGHSVKLLLFPVPFSCSFSSSSTFTSSAFTYLSFYSSLFLFSHLLFLTPHYSSSSRPSCTAGSLWRSHNRCCCCCCWAESFRLDIVRSGADGLVGRERWPCFSPPSTQKKLLCREGSRLTELRTAAPWSPLEPLSPPHTGRTQGEEPRPGPDGSWVIKSGLNRTAWLNRRRIRQWGRTDNTAAYHFSGKYSLWRNERKVVEVAACVS